MASERKAQHSLRGNQLAAALSKAGLVQNDVPRKLFEPVEIDERKVLPELREYLARLVAGERVSIGSMSPSLPKYKRGEVNMRLKARGLIEIKTGSGGGAVATPKLVELARRDISSNELRELTLEDPPWEEIVVADEETPTVETHAARPESVPVVDKGDTAAVLAAVRAWLMTNVEHDVHLRAARIGLGDGGFVYSVATRLRDADIVERVGEGSGSYLVVVDKERVRSLTDDELFAAIWPNGRKNSGPKPQEVDEPTVDEMSTSETPAFYPRDPEPSPQPPIGEDPFARVLDQLLTVLTRMDRRFDRLERALGMPPIEQEVDQ